MKVGLPLVHYFLEEELVDALIWLYPNGYIADEMINKCILASTNEVVDKWNSIVQQLKPQEQIYELNSHDYLCDVDDPYGYLARCLSETVLNSFNANGVPKGNCCKQSSLKRLNFTSFSRPIGSSTYVPYFKIA